MIIIDTSVWVDHFREPDEILKSLLTNGQVGLHPFVLGELTWAACPAKAMFTPSFVG
jgi:predicted nucleic acid-binding protein